MSDVPTITSEMRATGEEFFDEELPGMADYAKSSKLALRMYAAMRALEPPPAPVAETKAKTYAIENMPLEPTDRTGRPRLYPFPELQVGQCFFVPGKKADAVRNAAQQYRLRHGGPFAVSVRTVEGGVRVWRIA